MKAGLWIAYLAPFCVLLSPVADAGDWRSKYSTGGKDDTFQSCCGEKDCRTAESLGYPRMKRLADGSYEVKVGDYWLRYDFPAVHRSEDTKAWVCYMETYVEPEPLCLFLPAGII